MADRLLIVNADDFGMTHTTNLSIRQLFRQGALTSTTLLAPAPCAEEAVEMARQDSLPVGVHWTLNSEWPAPDAWPPAAGADAVPSLCENGVLWHDTKALAKNARRQDVARELESQVEWLREHGIAPTHADSHCGTLYGINGRLWFVTAFRLCRRYGLPFRLPKTSGLLRRQMGDGIPAPLSVAFKCIGGLGGLMGVPLPNDVITCPHPVEKLGSYEALREYYLQELRGAGQGVTEIFMHPCMRDEEMLRRSPQWEKREWEYRLLESGELQKEARRLGFHLVNWRQAFAQQTEVGK